ncbi:hypothetical protein ISTM_142 [Insectomime virus]|uniref:Peptidase S74 domain-containing protein n=1 Tax=Tunisvirus fontaine2 TaxID=1421067 RepID=V9SF02_9VIRU|nr:hypothetical protein D1R32_gp179 [Tunisvirus fontaine2]AHA46040.1 hypothetical protein ISTM_142 [Insectomime virus]AHC54896.1 hypothetical protein TNS_ORF178 [Tunisvirus fontaine2]
MENIKELTLDTERLQELSVKEFEVNGTKDFGLLPSEVEQVFPELVMKNAQGDAVAVRHLSLLSLLLAEVQRLTKRLEELE